MSSYDDYFYEPPPRHLDSSLIRADLLAAILAKPTTRVETVIYPDPKKPSKVKTVGIGGHFWPVWTKAGTYSKTVEVPVLNGEVALFNPVRLFKYTREQLVQHDLLFRAKSKMFIPLYATVFDHIIVQTRSFTTDMWKDPSPQISMEFFLAERPMFPEYVEPPSAVPMIYTREESRLSSGNKVIYSRLAFVHSQYMPKRAVMQFSSCKPVPLYAVQDFVVDIYHFIEVEQSQIVMKPGFILRDFSNLNPTLINQEMSFSFISLSLVLGYSGFKRC